MPGKSNVKRGVSLFSFWYDYMQGRMSLRDCIAAIADLDTQGVEIVGEHMVPEYPNPPDRFFDDWQCWMEQYGCTPVCYDMYVATKGPGGGPATEDDIVNAFLNDLNIAKRLGCTVMRMLVRTPPWLMERAAPYAAEHGIKLGLEIQAPLHLDDPWVVQHLEVMDRVASPYLGFIPDMSIFTWRFPRVMLERNIRDGAHENIARYIAERYDAHAPMGELVYEVRKMGGNEQDLDMLCQALLQTYWDPRRLRDIMPRIFHIHAKCFEMLEDYTEYSFPYDEVVPVLVEGGYNGYLSTESEGWRFTRDAYEVDSVEQVRRHQMMLKRLLGEE